MAHHILNFVPLLITCIVAFFYLKSRPPRRRPSTGGDDRGASLIVERVKTTTDMFRSYQVLLDGEVVGEVENGKTLFLEPSDGEHRLEVQIGAVFAREDVMISKDRVTRALVGRGRVMGGNAWTKPVIIVASGS